MWRTARPRTRLDPDTAERFLALRRQLGVSSFGINQIVLQPGQRGRIHRHKRQEEVYVVLEGTLTLVLEDAPTESRARRVDPGGAAGPAPAGQPGPGRLVLLALGGAGEHQGRDGEAFPSWADEQPVSPQELPMPPDLEPGELRS